MHWRDGDEVSCSLLSVVEAGSQGVDLEAWKGEWVFGGGPMRVRMVDRMAGLRGIESCFGFKSLESDLVALVRLSLE